jgi:hypothetical protein
MRVRAIVLVASAAALGVVAIHTWGCGSSDNTTQTEPVRQSRKGEACQVTGDCVSGLACQPIPGGAGGICVLGTFNVSVTAKECVLSECSVAADCCPTPPSNCAQLLQNCLALLDAGVTNACDSYKQQCQCDTTKRDCTSDRCIVHCSTDIDCISTGTAPKCSAGTCVQCVNDGDCGTGNGVSCLNGKCQAPCQGDGDCPGFQRCVDTKCIESGCQTDRECIASTRNVEATCGTDGKCIVPCQTDLECGSPKSYSFFSCVNAQCIYTGCQSDKDCRLLLTGPSDASTIPPKEHVVCRDKSTPGQTTIPAH